MGNSPSQAPANDERDEETKRRESSASGSGSGIDTLKAGAAVAGTALLALGTWQLLSQSSSSGVADAGEEEAVISRGSARVKSERVDSGGFHQFEGFQRPLPRNRGQPYASPSLGESSGAADAGEEEGVISRGTWRGKSDRVDSGGFRQFEGVQRPLLRNRGQPYASSSLGDVDSGSNVNFYKVLSYNIWFREDVELNRRMKALGDLIQQHSPDIICFQEVTPNIYRIFQGSSWWKSYQCSVPQEMSAERSYFCMQMSKLPVREFVRKPFSNSVMGRELCIVDTDVGRGKTLVVATSHLESPCPAPPKYDQMYSKERVAQAKESVQLLNKLRNAILCGDMNWDDKLDGAFPLPAGWVDAWTELRPGESGWTYDTKSNPMLTGNWPLQKRLDRFICNLQDLRIISIDMVGLEPIPGLSYTKEKRVKNHVKTLVLPVLPSDHYGLLLTMQGL